MATWTSIRLAGSLLVSLLIALAPAAATAQSSEIANPNPAVETRLKGLAHELRCLVCQNQTIADSDAPLAVDLRKQIRGMIAAGKTDDDIRAYMVERYGNFVLYKPPFSASTALLWAGPFVLLLIGVIVMVRLLKRRAPAAAAKASPSRTADLDRLLGDDPPLDGVAHREANPERMADPSVVDGLGQPTRVNPRRSSR